MENKDMWYSPNRLLSHNALLNICLSPRGNGKTYSAKDSYYTSQPKDINGELSLSNLCFEDLDKSTCGYELKDMIVYFDINNNSEYPISVNMEVVNEIEDSNFTFDCEQIGYIQDKDEFLDVKTQTAAFRVRYNNAEKVLFDTKNVELKITFEKLDTIEDTGVFRYHYDDETKTASVWLYRGGTSYTEVKVPRTIVLASTEETYVVTEIEDEAFKNNTTIKTVWLPDTLKKIGASAFLSATSLETIYMPDGLEYISYQAFARTGLTGDLYLPESLVKFDGIPGSYQRDDDAHLYEGLYAFSQVYGLEKVVFSEGIESIPVEGFSECTSLREIIFPTTLKAFLGYYYDDEAPDMASAFWGCEALVEVDLYNTNVIDGGSETFRSCHALTNVYFAKNQKTIGWAAYADCSALTDVVLSEKLEIIGVAAFADCIELKNINMPNALKEIRHTSFQYCYVLENISIPNGVEYIGDYAFNHCYAATNTTIKIPASVRQIGGLVYNAEGHDESLIGSHVFYDCATDTLTAFEVSGNNPYYMSIDGVLYRKEAGVPTVLVSYPAAKEDSVYYMPNTVVDSYELAMSRPYYLNEIVLSDSFVIRTICDTNTSNYLNEEWANNLSAMIYIFNCVTTVSCNATNQNYQSINGQIYSIDGKTLYYAPMYTGNDGETLTLDDGVETIFAGALGNDSNLENNSNSNNSIDDDNYLYRYDVVVIPNTVVYIDDITIGGINNQSWHIIIEEGNPVYIVNGSGDIEVAEAE